MISFVFFFLPTCQAEAAPGEHPPEEGLPQDLEAPQEDLEAPQQEAGEFSSMLAAMNNEEAEVPASSHEDKSSAVEIDDLEAMVEHWFAEPMATSHCLIVIDCSCLLFV